MATSGEKPGALAAGRPASTNTLFNVGGGTHWLPWIVAHPGVWKTYTI
jgi:hypothetical protein